MESTIGKVPPPHSQAVMGGNFSWPASTGHPLLVRAIASTAALVLPTKGIVSVSTLPAELTRPSYSAVPGSYVYECSRVVPVRTSATAVLLYTRYIVVVKRKIDTTHLESRSSRLKTRTRSALRCQRLTNHILIVTYRYFQMRDGDACARATRTVSDSTRFTYSFPRVL